MLVKNFKKRLEIGRLNLSTGEIKIARNTQNTDKINGLFEKLETAYAVIYSAENDLYLQIGPKRWVINSETTRISYTTRANKAVFRISDPENKFEYNYQTLDDSAVLTDLWEDPTDRDFFAYVSSLGNEKRANYVIQNWS